MEITLLSDGYTVLTKRDCGDCEKVKTLLESKHIKFTAIQCDDFLVGDARAPFLVRARELVGGTAPIRFPMVFHNGQYIGGLQGTRTHLEDEDW